MYPWFTTMMLFSMNLFLAYFTVEEVKHRHRIYAEAKAKVVASVWGAEFIQFLAMLL